MRTAVRSAGIVGLTRLMGVTFVANLTIRFTLQNSGHRMKTLRSNNGV